MCGILNSTITPSRRNRKAASMVGYVGCNLYSTPPTNFGIYHVLNMIFNMNKVHLSPKAGPMINANVRDAPS